MNMKSRKEFREPLILEFMHLIFYIILVMLRPKHSTEESKHFSLNYASASIFPLPFNTLNYRLSVSVYSYL